MAPMRPLWAIRSPRRHADGRAAALRARARHGAPRRRAGGGGDRRDAGAGEGCGRARRGRLRAAARRHRCARGAGAGAPQLHTAAPGNVCFRWARGDEAAVQAALRSAAHKVAIDLVNNRLIGAAIEPRAVIATSEPGTGKLTLYTSHPGAAPHPPAGHRAARHPGERDAPRLARRRRRLRLQGQALSRGDDRRLGGAPAAAAGAMDRAPAPRASSPTTRRAITSPVPSSRSTPTGTSSALHVDDLRQSRRLCLDLRRRHSERDLQRAARRRLPHAGDLRRGDRRVHQHAADRCLSRRRPAGGLLRAGAARRQGGAQARPRPRRDPAAQSHSARRDALQDADRADLRLRRFPEDLRARARDRRLRRLRQAARRRPPARAAARHRHGLLRRVLGRRAVALRRRARRARRLLRGGLDPRGAGRQRARCSAPTITARATPPRSRRSCRRGSACRSKGSRSSRATPTRCRTAPAPSARARSRSAAPRSIAPPTRSSPRAS